MLSNRLAFVALAIACIGAAAGGGYLATRQNTVPAPASAQTSAGQPAGDRGIRRRADAAAAAVAARARAAPAKAVQETEGVVGDTRRARRAAPAAEGERGKAEARDAGARAAPRRSASRARRWSRIRNRRRR